MKLYIPTTTLNFNNILSTESISPKGFYASRGFGYSRWFSIPENDFDRAILLYESPAAFVRPQSDVEDHPLLIEIETDKEFPIAMEGVRYSKHSIYLDPWHTRFIFLNEKDRTIAYSLSDSSLETKMLRLYYKKIVVESIQGSFPVLKDFSIDDNFEDSYIEQDRQINKIKGLLYGYYIGAYLSSSKDDIEQINILKEIQNIFASVVSSLERTPSQAQKERLEYLFTSYTKKEPLYQELLAEIGSIETTNNVLSILQKYGIKVVQLDWKRIVAKLQYNDKESNHAIVWIKSEISNLLEKMDSRKMLLYPDAEEIITSNGLISKVSSINDDESLLYISWINNVLIKSRFNGKVSSTKEELADAITKSAIDALGDKWGDSPIRTFLNQLRHHVRGGEFTQSWNNGALSSIAAVITKGDDWEKLLSFMQSKGMTDYRIAFSFYGVLNGFANLTRDFTDILLNQKSAYVADVYREFYGQLHGVTIDITKLVNLNVSKDETEQIVEEHRTQNTSSEESTKENFIELRKKIWEFFNSFAPRSGKKKEKLEEGLRLCLERYSSNINISQFITELNDFGEYGWSKSNKPWKLMQEHLIPDYEQCIRKSPKKRDSSKLATISERDLFDSISNDDKTKESALKENKYSTAERVLVYDDNCWSFIQQIIPHDLWPNVLEDLKWFQGEYKKGEQSKFYAKASRENRKSVEAFIRYLGKKKYSSKISLDQIEKQLKEIYVRQDSNYE